jgi:hypothetical protein
MFAAARRPEATRSLTVLEAPAVGPAVSGGAWRALVDDMRALWREPLPDRECVVRFLTSVGSDPDLFPPEMLALAVPLVPVFRRGRPFFEAELPLAELDAARFPKLVVSGGHSAGFEEMCDVLAARIGGSRAVVEGAGHEIQFTGPAINKLLLSLWRPAPPSS